MANLDKNRMNAFIEHLFNNPNIKNEPILIGETLIINFVTKNLNTLKELLRTPQFFPDAEFDEILQFMLTTLRDKVINKILPFLTEYIDKNIDFSVINKISTKNEDAAIIKNKLIEFVTQIIKHKDVRYHFNGIINIFKYGALARYLSDIFDRREFIYNELVKVQKLNLPVEDFINYLKILLLIKNVVYIKIPIEANGKNFKLNWIDMSKVPQYKNKFFTIIMSVLRKELGELIPEDILRMAVKSNYREEETELNEASARLLYILTHRFQDYKHYEKIDRGAETPDKSWFNIAKKNASYYGFEKRMLEELYKIAADNNW